MKILAFECSAGPASVAVIENGTVLASAFINVKLTHSQTLLPLANDVLSAAHISFDEIEGLGKKKINALLVKFGSVAEIAAADIEELKAVEGIGEKHAQRIYSHFHDKGEL